MLFSKGLSSTIKQHVTSRLRQNNKKNKKGRKEKEAHSVLALFSLFLKTRLVNLFSHDMSIILCLALMSLFIALD